MTLNDMEKLQDISNPPAPIVQQASYEAAPRFEMASNDNALPESLQTPTITVEELSAPGKAKYQSNEPVWNESNAPVVKPTAKKLGGYTDPLAGHLDTKGRFMPDAVVQNESISPTGIFVQAGSFSVYENAERLSVKLSNIAPAKIEPVNIQGRQLYRVKLGPIANVSQADAVLEKVIRAGNDTAKVVKD